MGRVEDPLLGTTQDSVPCRGRVGVLVEGAARALRALKTATPVWLFLLASITELATDMQVCVQSPPSHALGSSASLL